MRTLIRCVFAVAFVAVAAPAGAQRQQAATPPLANLAPEAQSALDELDTRFAMEFALRQGWFRDRTVLYYDFGRVPEPLVAARVIWPIHGFDAKGNPVAIRGQRPIFTVLPGMPGYTGLWRIAYLVTADHAQPNTIRDAASIDAAVRSRRASLRETDATYNLPLVPRGSRLERDSTPAMLGWFEGREVQFFDFGAAGIVSSPMWRFARGADVSGEPNPVADQNSVVDSIPSGSGSPDLWEIRWVRVDSAYVANSLKSAAAVGSAGVAVDPPSSVRNLPVVLIDGARVPRPMSPLTVFADRRSPFPPAPTPPQ
jgi:hypothetical protein